MLAELGRQTFCDSFAHLYKAEDLNAFLQEVFSAEAVRREMSNPRRQYLIAEQDGAFAGYCKIGYCDAANGPSLDYDTGTKRVVELKQLYIRAAYHGQGVAQRMMAWALEAAREYRAEAILLSVYSENPRAQAFYKKFGFAHVADTVFMVGRHADHEFIYLKSLIDK